MGKCGLESPVMGTKASGDDRVVQKGIDNVAYEQTDTHYGDESSCRYIQGEFSLDGENKPDVRKDSPHREQGTGQDGKAADENEGQKVKYTWQVVATLVMSLIHLSVGTIYGYPGVMLPELTDPSTTDIFLSTNEAALFSSLSSLGAGFGAILGGVFLVRLGQRTTLLIGVPLTAAAWLGLAFAGVPWLIHAMRCVLGITTGFIAPATGIYILEISHKKSRGVFYGVLTTVRQMGFLCVYALGSSDLGWRNVSLVCAGIALVPFLALFFLPNAPRWLVTQNRVEEARKSLAFFRGKDYDSTSELKAITDQVGQHAEQNKSFITQVKMMMEPATLRTLALLVVISVLSTLSGYIIVTTYTVTILQSTQGDLDAYISTIIIGAVRVGGTLVHLAVIDRFGRKPLLVASFALGTLCVAGLGGYFYIQNTTGDASYLGWLPLTCMVVLIFCMGIGQPVVSIVQGELLPTTVRAAGVSLIMILLFLAGFVLIQTYPLLSGALGEHGAFWLYSGASLALVLVGGLRLPETRGRSLEEISGRRERRASLSPSLA
ncbi:facilitated trehalose transporter Tret1-2 homolog [Penaeus vannamei]|uniref:facilitated trehalose transporter Tret1-2 homolog n=1 Tax=Penaeus vannamei TaxID=6689 RepID=UPI00387F3A15